MFPTAYQRNDHYLQLWTTVAITAIFRIAMSHTGGMDTGNYGPGDMYVTDPLPSPFTSLYVDVQYHNSYS